MNLPPSLDETFSIVASAPSINSGSNNRDSSDQCCSGLGGFIGTNSIPSAGGSLLFGFSSSNEKKVLILNSTSQ